MIIYISLQMTCDATKYLSIFKHSGELSERLKEHAWKACVRETVPRVRIPNSPPLKFKIRNSFLRSDRGALVLRNGNLRIPSGPEGSSGK